MYSSARRTSSEKTLLTGKYSGISSPVGAPVNQTFDSVGVTAAMARPNYFENPILTAPDTVAPVPLPGGSTEFANVLYTQSSAIDGTFFGAVTGGGAGNRNETMRFQYQPGVIAANVTSLQFNFVGGSDANGTSPDNIRYQLFDFQANAWVDVGNNNTGTLLAFTAGTSNPQVVNPSRFFDPSGDVWAQAWVQTDAAASNELRIDYASLQVTTQATTSASPLKLQAAGANKGETIDVTLPDARRAALGLSGLSVATRTNAESAITTATNALTTINGSRAEIGAYQNRLERSSNFESIQAQNQTAAESRIRDLDFSSEIVEFTKQQILQQAGVSALAQANVAPQAVLQLLK